MTTHAELHRRDPQKTIPIWGWLCLLVIFVSGIIIQSCGFLSHDVSWLLHATDRFLAGGNYISDFYEINPPMALYIHIPPVMLAHFSKLSLISSLRIYVFTIALLSFYLSTHLLKKIINPKDRLLYCAFLITLALVFIISPASNFGQREHIALMLIIPYLLNAVIFLQGDKLNYSILIGLMAGTGFAIKPHLLVTFVLIESYLLVKTRAYVTLFRKETIAIGLVFSSYLIAVLVFNPDYFLLIPEIYKFFSVFFASADSLTDIFFNDRVVFIIETVIIFYALHTNSAYQNLVKILMLSMVGFFIFYIAEPLAIDYHTIPMFSLALLLSVVLFSDTHLSSYRNRALLHKNHLVDRSIIFGIAAVIFWIPLLLMFSTTSRFLTVEKNSPVSNQLIEYLKNTSDRRPFYFFSTNCRLTYPLVDYVGVKSASRYECLWPVLYITQLSQLNTPVARAELEKQRIFLTHTVVEDMKRNMPGLVFISPSINWRVFYGVSFDYLKFFSQSKEFRDIWKNYKYSSSVGEISIYKNINEPVTHRGLT